VRNGSEGERVRMTRDWDLGHRQRYSGDEASLGLGSSEADYEQVRGA